MLSVAVTPVLLFALGCESDEPTTKVSVQASFIVDTATPVSAEGGGECGRPQPVKLATRDFTITAVDGERAIALDGTGGCELELAVAERTYTAENVKCRLAEDAPLRKLGVLDRTYEIFVLNLNEGTYVARYTTIRTTSSGQVFNCAVEEGRVVHEK